jgi:hypothetical protein
VRVLLIASLFVCLVGCGSKEPPEASIPVDTTDKTPLKLRVKVKQGDQYTYRSIAHMEDVADGADVDWEMEMDETAAQVQDSRTTWSMKLRIISFKSSESLKEMEDVWRRLEGTAITMTYDELGQLKKLNGLDTSEPTANIVFSPKAVAPGDTWPAHLEVNGQRVDVVYTFVGRGLFDGKPAVLCQGEIAKGQPVHSVGPSKHWIEIATGKLLHSKGEFVMVTPTRVKASFEMKRMSGPVR